jgi:hypothetical protein
VTAHAAPRALSVCIVSCTVAGTVQLNGAGATLVASAATVYAAARGVVIGTVWGVAAVVFPVGIRRGVTDKDRPHTNLRAGLIHYDGPDAIDVDHRRRDWEMQPRDGLIEVADSNLEFPKAHHPSEGCTAHKGHRPRKCMPPR